jgi:mannose-6-phosphate isomerase-like protein (cupin superfamily)
MELQPGLFVSSAATDEWEPDPDVGGLMHVLCDLPGYQAGFTRYDTAPPPIHWTPETRETFIILEGSARIEIAGGETLDLGPGGVASLPAGTDTTWHITAPFREFWVIGQSATERS